MNPALRQLLLGRPRATTDILVSKLFARGELGGLWVPELRPASQQRVLLKEGPSNGDVLANEGDGVGMLLDQSGGLSLGSALTFSLVQLTNNTGTATDNGNGTYTLTDDARARFNCTLASMVNGAVYRIDLSVSAVTGRTFWDWCDAAFSPNIDYAGSYVGFGQRATYDASFRFLDVSPQVSGPSVTFSAPIVRRLAGNHMVQATEANRPTFQTNPDRLVFDGTDSLVVTFATSLGSDCTVIRSVPGQAASVLEGQTIGTSYTDSTTHCGLLIVNRRLTSSEMSLAVQWANDRSGYSQVDSSFLACWGDSLTAGAQDAKTDGYPRRLSEGLGRPYYNGGVGGETSTQIKTRVLADTYGRNSWVNVFWLGRNNATSTTTVKSDIASCISNLASGSSKYLVLSVLTSDADSAGTVSTIQGLNSDLATLYGSRFVDVIGYLQTKGDGSANDNADIAAGYVPRSLRVDSVHLNGTGYQHVADRVQTALRSLGY